MTLSSLPGSARDETLVVNRRTKVIGVLLILTLASWWILNPASRQGDSSQLQRLDAGYYLTNAAISDTDEAGVLVYSLRAERIEHNPRDNSVSLLALHLLYDQTDNEGWQIKASEGWMDGERAQMILRGKVQIVGKFDDDAPETTINTTRLIVNLKDNIARTNEPVQIGIAGGLLEADGLHADLKTQKIKLLSNVRGTFDTRS
ncbi:MAG: LPS export ABC transporter periplasmic protein LptC [Gammaproteobacteria bacterium]|nr:LPS export ABC transporter periplasmic protein LptC [Gammaproteobacteria bacterium]